VDHIIFKPFQLSSSPAFLLFLQEPLLEVSVCIPDTQTARSVFQVLGQRQGVVESLDADEEEESSDFTSSGEIAQQLRAVVAASKAPGLASELSQQTKGSAMPSLRVRGWTSVNGDIFPSENDAKAAADKDAEEDGKEKQSAARMAVLELREQKQMSSEIPTAREVADRL